MGRVHAVEAAAIGPHHFHGYKRRQRTDDDSLLLGLSAVGRAHRGRLKRRDLIVTLISHRHSLDQEDNADDESCGQKHVHNHSPHIDEEVAQARIASERANDRRESTQSDCSREEKHRDAKEDLREIREGDVPRIVLYVGVSDK